MKADKFIGERLDKAYKRYLGYYDMYAKGSRMNEAKLSKSSFRGMYLEYKGMGTSTERKNIARAIAGSQRTIEGLDAARNYQKIFADAGYNYTLKEIRKMDWTAKYNREFPDSDYGESVSQAQSLFFIASELGYDEEAIYATE